MDEVTFDIHIEPLSDAAKELNERVAHISMLLETDLEAVHRLEAKLHTYESWRPFWSGLLRTPTALFPRSRTTRTST
ncbi:hypothetical protein Y032_0188g1152 [Ancylostoma ceylanicum]|uniref:Uncharacterized protein n=1 Tax=Ancylostoma ceylanicum TaxID=53326 RepID=A0A016SRK6_9BILA|nr:hypothetical protein Y032_0188g1152 [Ancylostoma ceylanicum]